MSGLLKGKSPFYPGQPVPTELFVGRAEQIRRIMDRGVGQVAVGKPIAMFVEGDYGIGKSSIAAFVQRAAEAKHGLHPIYALLGGSDSLDDVAAAILQATLRSGAFTPRRAEEIRNWLARYIGKQSLAGLTLNMEALRADAPKVATASGLLDFLSATLDRIRSDGTSGIFLVMDEVNGITKNAAFAHFIKALIDTNAMLPVPLPLLLMICGVEERRRELIRAHAAIDRVFDVVQIDSMSPDEMKEFFRSAFESVHMRVEDEALESLAFYSAGLPKMMHIVGDEAFWATTDAVIDVADVHVAAIRAAEEVGKKYVDQQVFAALRSADYRSILGKIAGTDPFGMTFRRADVLERLTVAERGKLDNFLQKMKKLHVLRSSDAPGEYVFTVRMVRLFIWLDATRQAKDAPPAG